MSIQRIFEYFKHSNKRISEFERYSRGLTERNFIIMDIIINKENRLDMQTPNAKQALLKTVNKRPLADVLNVVENERRSPGFDKCSTSPLKEKGNIDFEDFKCILKQSAEAAKEIKSISPTFNDCVESLPEELDDEDELNDFFKYKELDEPDDFHDIFPRDAWPTQDEIRRMILGICDSYVDNENDHKYNIQLEQPVDDSSSEMNDYYYTPSVLSEVSFSCSDIDFDMFSDDEIDE